MPSSPRFRHGEAKAVPGTRQPLPQDREPRRVMSRLPGHRAGDRRGANKNPDHAYDSQDGAAIADIHLPFMSKDKRIITRAHPVSQSRYFEKSTKCARTHFPFDVSRSVRSMEDN